MRLRHYSDYLMAKPGCLPKMTKEFSDGHPAAWLGFYPHQTFLRVLSTLFEKFEVGDRSVWMYGAYGTGKSYVALVIQKLFSDTGERVAKYCADYKELIKISWGVTPRKVKKRWDCLPKRRDRAIEREG